MIRFLTLRIRNGPGKFLHTEPKFLDPPKLCLTIPGQVWNVDILALKLWCRELMNTVEHFSKVTNPFTGPYVQRRHRGQLLRVLPQPAVRDRLQPRVLRRAGPKQVTDWQNLPGNRPDIDNQHFRVKSLDHWRHHSKQSCKEISAPPIWISSVQLQIDELLFDSVSK